ncbi:glycosyltransferase family 2 protein [Halorussus halobius]|uniref:glycosyltransferase family 2 protein n=1 Tax=Halorussus halobius TaxID=1710537 RepID=UPI001091A363|nr:glycosyltransferase family 2 protein [Halorussus halobius]
MGSTSEKTKTEHVAAEISAEERSSPAVSVVAADLDVGTVARTILRADERDVFAFVVVDDADSVVGALADELGALVLELDPSDRAAGRESVERVARALGFPGVLHVDRDATVDFSRFEAAAEAAEGYGAPAPLADRDDGQEDDVGHAGDGSGVGNGDASAVETVAAIPAYNEGKTIGSVVTDVRRHVDEVLVVDDGSTDDTVAAAERAGATVVEHGTNRGYGAALKSAFEAADARDADALVTLDGDGQHDVDDVPKLLDAQRETGASVVVGNRFHDDASHRVPRYRRVGLFVINVLTNVSLGGSPARSWVTDTQSGFRAFDRDAIRSLAADDTLSENMSASTDILYHARRRGYDVAEVDTTISYDGEETSTQNPVVHGVAVVGNILRTVERERPLTFVGLPGVAAVLVGVGTGYWAVANYVQSGTFPVGIVLFCLFSTFLGALLSFTGVILHALNAQIETLVTARTRP